ncbi:WD40/PQQ-like beta propeller repeat containing protein [Halalkaliarchaeum desulfuricum]|uniref:WD40/PQQ-like beta propeller repeat containing protein n=1 Tax=Halalkaliarchaeum desulfuricum TaxID=2055893 RepID=A0A343TN45_9EURY|nr:PQQ-binding-like beta-propeller repeat protein [Halalkaliarchaeum desulfuricum]AUX10517.1 WD40/PQQ-like beta propeller repeat containing protein [Halalkaliarchaeum desulfuricum]
MNRRTFLATVGVGGVALTSGCQGLAGADRLEWRFETGGSVTSIPAVDDGIVYTGSRDGSVYAIDAASGESDWQFDADGTVHDSPTVADGTLYVGSNDGYLYALSI